MPNIKGRMKILDVLLVCVYNHILMTQTLIQRASSSWQRVLKEAMDPGQPRGLIETVFQQQGKAS